MFEVELLSGGEVVPSPLCEEGSFFLRLLKNNLEYPLFFAYEFPA